MSGPTYTFQTLASFSTTNGTAPANVTLTFDSAGNLYGTTESGGSSGDGTVFEIANGSSAITTLASFNNANGNFPLGGVIIDSAGNLYGTTELGGASGDGTVFEIPKGGSLVTLASFNGSNGQRPAGGLIADSSGNLYGTTSAGGASGYGSVFEIAKGSGTITTLASFNFSNGSAPAGSLVADSAGNLYGAAESGGASDEGTIFEIAKGSGTITTLATFSGGNGQTPNGDLITDSSGNIYGTTESGGPSGGGTVFEIVKGSGTVTTLASFNGTNGSAPTAGLYMDGAGNLYGTTELGGSSGDGTVFEVAKGSGTVTTLVTFDGSNGSHPLGRLNADSAGNLYGTTPGGGVVGYGTVFKLTLVRPSITSESSSSPSGSSINAGKTVTFTLNFSQAVTVSGTPTLTLNTGTVANYVSGSGGTSLTFAYTVPSGTNLSDLQATALNLPNGATIQASGVSADLSGFHTIDSGVHLDSIAPVISSVTLDKAAYGLGNTVTATIQLAGSYDGNSVYALKSGSTIDGMTLGSAVYNGTTNTITASFTVRATTNEVIDGSLATNVTVSDAAGNASGAYTTAISGTTIDTHAPTQVSVDGFSNSPGGDSGTSAIAAGSIIGALSTVDATSGDSFTYALGGPDADKFAISNSTLVVGGSELAYSTSYDLTITSRDLGGNSYTENVTVSVVAPPPNVASIDRVSGAAALTNASTDSFTVTFSEAVTGVSASNFSLSGTDGTGTITGVSSTDGGLTWTVDVGSVSGNGTLGVDLTSTDGITSAATGETLAGTHTSDQAYTIDTTPPVVNSIVPAGANPGRGGTETFTVTFSEKVTGVDTSDFTIVNNGTTASSIGGVSTVDGIHYTVSVANVGGNGTLGLNLNNDAAGIIDLAGNAISSGFTGSTYTIDTTPPSVSSVTAVDALTNNASTEQFTVTFSEAVTGVGLGDFSLATTSTPGGTALTTGGTTSITTGDNIHYTVTVGGVAGDGTLQLDLKPNSTGITDAAGNGAQAAYTSGATYTIDHTPPTIVNEEASPLGGDLDGGKTVTFKIGTSEAVTATGSSLALNNGATAIFDTADSTPTSLVYAYTVASGDTNTGDLQATALNGTITDVAGNALDDTTFTAIDTSNIVDTTPPTLSSISTVSPGGSDLDAGQTITFSVVTNEQVSVTGTPILALNLDGKTAAYTGGDGTAGNPLVFTYRVAAGDNVADLTVTGLTQSDGNSIADLAGNPFAAGVTDDTGLHIDTTPPTITSGLASPTDSDVNGAKTITFTINMSEAVDATGSTLTLSNGQTAALSAGNGTGTLSYVYTIASDDANTSDLKATALNGTITDLAGNPLDNGGFTTIDANDVVDTIAPATPAAPTDASATNGYLNAANDTSSQTLKGTAEAGSTVTIYDAGVLVGTADADATTGAWSYQLGALADGSTHSYTVTATDAARNTSLPSGALAFTVDTTAPTISIETPVAGDNVINKAEAAAGVTVTGTTLGAEDGQTVTIKLIDATNNVVATDTGTVSSGVWSATLTASQAQALADGSYTLAADVYDKAGNPATEATQSISVDETPPGAPFVALTHDTGSSATDNLTRDPSLTYTLSAQGDTLLYKIDGASAYTSTAPSFATDGSADGKHTVSVEEVDAAGNIGPATTFTFTLDTIAPAAPTLTASSSATSASGAPTLLSLFTGGTTSGLSGKAEPGSTITFYDNGVILGTTTTSANGTYSFANPKLVKGANRIQTTATDAAGNTSGLSNAVTLTNGSGLVAAPSTPVLTAASDTGRSASDRITSDTTPTFTGTAKTGTTVTLYDGNTVIGSMLIGATGKYSITTSPLTDGPYSVTAIATDTSGNMSYPSATTTLTVDTLAPATPTLTAGNTSQTRPLLTGTAEAGSTVTIYDNGAKLGTTTATAKGTYSYTTPTLSQNVHDLTVTATDAAGNVSDPSADLFVGSKPVQNLSHALFAAAFAPGAASTPVIPTVTPLPPTIAADVLNLFVHHA